MLKPPSAARRAVFLVIALIAGFTAYLASRQLLTPPQAPPLPAAPAVAGPATIPERRPDIRLADRDGQLRSLSEWDGKTQVVNFWATWCAPCRREIPMLNALARDHRDRGLEVIGIAVDFREDVLKYLQSTPVDYTVLIGEQDGLDAARAFGMETIGLPFTAFVDRSGRIVTIHVGELQRSQAELILSVLRELEAGAIDMSAARAKIRAGAADPGQPGT